MESRNQEELGAGRIAAALSAALKGLSEIQEAQKRIEDQQKKSGTEIAQFQEQLWKGEKDLGQGMNHLADGIESVRDAAVAIGRSLEKPRQEKKRIRWKHHLRAGGIILSSLGFGLLVGWCWALNWLRVDETQRIALDSERNVGHAVMVNFEQADEMQRDLITLLISGDTMSKDQQQKIREWLEARSGKVTAGKSGK